MTNFSFSAFAKATADAAKFITYLPPFFLSLAFAKATADNSPIAHRSFSVGGQPHKDHKYPYGSSSDFLPSLR